MSTNPGAEQPDVNALLVQLDPDMALTAELGLLAQQMSLGFPVQEANDLATFLEQDQRRELIPDGVTVDWLKSHAPRTFFPVEDLQDFLWKVLAVIRTEHLRRGPSALKLKDIA